MSLAMNKSEINIEKYSAGLLEHIAGIIKNAQHKVAIFLNAETTLLYWSVGDYINSELKSSGRTSYGSEILATLSQQLSWSHLIELAYIDEPTKQDFYTQLPGKKWFADKLHRALEIVKQKTADHA
jgi:hypothetical protein